MDLDDIKNMDLDDLEFKHPKYLLITISMGICLELYLLFTF